MKSLKSIILCALACVTLGLTSCDDYLDVNRNTDAPDYVEGYLYLAGIQQAYQGIYWDIRAIGPLTQMMGTSSYTNFANHYSTKASDAGGEAWRMVYWNQGMNLENMINQSVEAENWTLAGILKYPGAIPFPRSKALDTPFSSLFSIRLRICVASFEEIVFSSSKSLP